MTRVKGFHNSCLQTLKSVVLLKMKYVHENQAPFTSNELQNAIMLRSKLSSKFLKDQIESNKKKKKKESIIKKQ